MVIVLDATPLGLVTNPRMSGEADDTAAMRQAAVFWAQARQQGQPTAPAAALDGDAILAAQAVTLDVNDEMVIIATSNPSHLSRFTLAQQWQDILPPPNT